MFVNFVNIWINIYKYPPGSALVGPGLGNRPHGQQSDLAAPLDIFEAADSWFGFFALVLGLIGLPTVAAESLVGKAVFAVLSVLRGCQVELVGAVEDGDRRVPLEVLFGPLVCSGPAWLDAWVQV